MPLRCVERRRNRVWGEVAAAHDQAVNAQKTRIVVADEEALHTRSCGNERRPVDPPCLYGAVKRNVKQLSGHRTILDVAIDRKGGGTVADDLASALKRPPYFLEY